MEFYSQYILDEEINNILSGTFPIIYLITLTMMTLGSRLLLKYLYLP